MRLHLERRALEALRAHAERAYPEEACGLLVGTGRAGETRVVEAFPLANRAERPRRAYRIAPEDFLTVERRARDRDLDVVGVYHSHPDRPASPSPTDREEAWPSYAYWIAEVRSGLAGHERAWRLRRDGSQFEEIPIVEGEA